MSNSDLFEAKVISILKEEPIEVNGINQTYQELEVKTSGDNSETHIIKNGEVPMTKQNLYQIGDKLILSSLESSNPDEASGSANYQITDYARLDGLLVLGIILVVAILAVARKRGLLALISLAFTFLIIFKLTLPFIMAGHNPFLTSILSLIIIIPVTFYLTHGWSKKTHAAVLATLLSLLLTIVLAQLAVRGIHLTGLASEDAAFVLAQVGESIDIRGLLLAGMILATLGVVNDVTVSQASVVQTLKKNNPKLSFKALYKDSMQVGRDHITSMIDTLVLSYAGASLPLLLLLGFGRMPFWQALNFELIAEEITRTIVGSLGLVVAVPLTTAIAALFYEYQAD